MHDWCYEDMESWEVSQVACEMHFFTSSQLAKDLYVLMYVRYDMQEGSPQKTPKQQSEANLWRVSTLSALWPCELFFPVEESWSICTQCSIITGELFGNLRPMRTSTPAPPADDDDDDAYLHLVRELDNIASTSLPPPPPASPSPSNRMPAWYWPPPPMGMPSSPATTPRWALYYGSIDN